MYQFSYIRILFVYIHYPHKLYVSMYSQNYGAIIMRYINVISGVK